jgi:uncharacterized protein (DUF58 family)
MSQSTAILPIKLHERPLIRRVYLRVEGWYYLFVIVFVIGGAVLRNVNILVALAGLMAAALILHWQLVLRSLSGIDVIRSLPARTCAGDAVEIEVTVMHRGRRGSSWALEFTDYLQRIDPPDDEPANEVQLLFPRIVAGQEVTRRYRCLPSRRGVYRFSKARIASRYPLGLVEGSCFLDLPDRLVVYPEMGRLSRRWSTLIEAEHAGQQSTRHRRGWNEGDFYALREWRNGDSRRWIHWRTSAKLGKLAVRQFEQRRSCDVVLLVDLHQSASPSNRDLAVVEATISFAATAVVDLCRRGGSSLGLVVASRETGQWHGAASPLFAQELLEHLSVCRASDVTHLTNATDRLDEMQQGGGKLLVISGRSRDDAAAALDRKTRDGIKWRRLEQAVWLNGSAGDFEAYFSLDGASPA